VPVADLPLRHAAAWDRATRHPFLLGVRDGSIAEAAFDTWLAQDALFVFDLVRFQSRLLARVPRGAQAVLAGGLVALVNELAWFEETRPPDRAATALPATAAYARLLERLDTADAAIALTALWTIECVYLDAWSFTAPGAPAYRECVARWTTPQFAAYVQALGEAADTAVDTATAGPDLDAVVTAVLHAEVAFWEMAVEGAADVPTVRRPS